MKKGQVKILNDEDRSYYRVNDVRTLLSVSEPKAYQVIRALRKEMIAAKLLSSVYPAGRIPKWYFEQYCGVVKPPETDDVLKNSSCRFGPRNRRP